MSWHNGELIGFDLETTGVNRHEDVPVSFGLVRVLDGVIVEVQAAIVDPGRDIPEEAIAIHGITSERARAEGRPLAETLAHLFETLLDAQARSVPVVGMNLSYDLSLLDHQLRLVHGEGLAERGWAGPVLDVLVLDRHLDRFRRGKRRLVHLCSHYCVEVATAHEAGADAEAAVLVLLALCQQYPAVLQHELDELTALQATWHREWAESYDAWRARQGLSRLLANEFEWPLARAPLTSLSGAS